MRARHQWANREQKSPSEAIIKAKGGLEKTRDRAGQARECESFESQGCFVGRMLRGREGDETTASVHARALFPRANLQLVESRLWN